MSSVIQIVLGVALFLVAAKAHGRQLRVEREAEGIREVSFGRGSQNPPFVVALWRRERWLFWPAAIATALALGLATELRWPLAFIVIPGTIGFAIGGGASLVRLARRGESVRSSLLWWAATLVLAVALTLTICPG